MTLIYIALVIIIVFLFLSTKSLHDLRKKSISNNRNGINDERYYELKYKLQYISSIGVVVIGVLAFFGYDKYDTFVERFGQKADSLHIKIDEYDKKITHLDSLTRTYDNKISIYDDFILRIQKDRRVISNDFKKSNSQLSRIKDTINNIKKRNILDKSFYIIDNLTISKNKENQIRGKIYFSDLTTIIGDKLPNFEKSPFLLIVPKTSAYFDIINVTPEYVELGIATSTIWEDKSELEQYKFGLLISKKN